MNELSNQRSLEYNFIEIYGKYLLQLFEKNSSYALRDNINKYLIKDDQIQLDIINNIYTNVLYIIGIDPLIPKLMNRHSGGAQYIVSGEGAEFWKKVEHDSVRLYTYFCKEEPNHKKKLIFPKLVFIHNEEKHNENCEYEYLFNYAIKCSSENMYPDYIGKGHRRNGKIVSPMG
jgi:hypothetical protein